MAEDTPFISIIVPCFNQAHYLPEALESIQRQTYHHWECIIIDDGSTDNTGEVAWKWLVKDNRFRYMRKENGGLSSARNAGLEIAKGDYIQLLDADDLLESDKITHQVDFLQRAERAIDVVVSGYRYFQDTPAPENLLLFGRFDLLPEVAMNYNDNRDEIIKLMARVNPMVVSAPLYLRDVFQRVGNFDESLGALEDWDLHFRCAMQGIVFQHSGYLPKTKTLIRLHEHSLSTDRRNMLRSLANFRRKHKNNIMFAQENGLFVKSVGESMYRIFKMLVPPIFVWLIKKLLGYA